MTKKATILLMLIALSAFAFGQKIKRSDCKHHIGVTGGNSMGYGLSYLYQPQKSGFQLTFSPYFTPEKENVNASFTYSYIVSKSHNINLAFYLSEDIFVDNSNADATNRYSMTLEKTGVGLAYQFYLSRKFKLNVYTGIAFQYSAYSSMTFDGLNFVEGIDKEIVISPDAGVSLFFMF